MPDTGAAKIGSVKVAGLGSSTGIGPLIQFNLQNRSPFTRVTSRTKGAMLPDLEIQLLNNTTPVVMTGSTVSFVMKDESGTTKVSAAGTLSDPVNGKVQYAFSSSDVDTAGNYWGQFIITPPSGSSRQYKIPDCVDQFLLIKIATGYA